MLVLNACPLRNWAGTLLPLLLAFTATVCVASPIPVGPVYLHTEFALFQTSAGGVQFQSNPFGPGNTDTVINRLDAHSGTVSGTPEPIQIEIVQLSLVSVAPVLVATSFFDVFMTLDAAPSVGVAQISHNFPDDGTPAAEGFFTLTFNLNYRLTFVEVGDPLNTFVENRTTALESIFPFQWSHDGPSDHYFDGFFDVVGEINVESRNDGWVLTNSSVPEPGTLGLFTAGAMALLARAIRRRGIL